MDFGDSGGTSNKDDLIDGYFLKFGVSDSLLDALQSRSEEISAKFLESGSGKGGVEINTFVQSIDFDGGLSGR